MMDVFIRKLAKKINMKKQQYLAVSFAYNIPLK